MLLLWLHLGPKEPCWLLQAVPNSQHELDLGNRNLIPSAALPLKTIMLQDLTDESWNLSKPKPNKAEGMNYCYKLPRMMEDCLHIWSTRFLKLSYWKGQNIKMLLLPSVALTSINQLTDQMSVRLSTYFYGRDALSQKGRRQAEGLKGRQWNFYSTVNKSKWWCQLFAQTSTLHISSGCLALWTHLS